MLSVGLLGPFSLSCQGRQLSVPSLETAVALLGYVLMETQTAAAASAPFNQVVLFHRRRLAQMLWPGTSLAYARKNLRQSLYAIRKALPPQSALQTGRPEPLLSASRTAVHLNPNFPLELDAARYLVLSGGQASLTDLEEAASLYRGEFLADIYIGDSPDFDQWLSNRRLEFSQQQLDLLSRLAERYIARGDLARASELASAQLEMEPTSEHAHRQLMLVTALAGHRRAAVAQYQRCSRLLWEQLEIVPSPETEALHRAIAGGTLERWLRAHPGEGPVDSQLTRGSPPPMAGSVPTNLPYLPRPLFNRRETMGQLRELLAAPDCRLVTITGPGGIGKSLLALNAGHQLLSDARLGAVPFADGVFLAALDQVADLPAAYHAIARAVALKLDSSLDSFSAVEAQLHRFLRRRELLLILDDIDDLLHQAVPMLELLLDCPGVHLMVTSRERLAIRAERIISLSGLSCPDAAAAGDQDWVEQSEAAQLFITTAQRVHPQFQLDLAQDGPPLAQICRMTQGNPLALELAAGRAPFIGVAAVAAQLEHSLDILLTTNVDQPERHRSMRAVFDHSWEHISQRQRRILSIFSVFRKGCTLEAAGRIAGATFSELIDLTGKSLLVLDRRNRYALPGVLRRYCAEKLALRPELQHSAGDAHADYYCQLLLDWAAIADGASRQASLTAITIDSGNILAAWRYSLAHGRLSPLIRIIHSLDHYFAVTGLFSESRAFFEQTVADLRRLYGDFPQDPDAIRLICLALGCPGGDSARIYRFHNGAEREALEAGLRYGLELLGTAAAQGDDLKMEEAFLRRRLAQLLARQPESRIQAQLSRDLFQEAGHLRGSVEMALTAARQDVAANIPTGELLDAVGKAAVTAESIQDAYLITQALVVKAQIVRHRLNAPERALSLLGEAYQAAVNSRMFGDAIAANRDAARLNWSIGDHEHALQLQRQAVDLARQYQLTIAEAALLVEIGCTYFHMGDFPEADRYARKSIALDSDAGGYLGLHRLQTLCALHQGQYGRAQRIAGLVEDPDCWMLRVKAWIAIAEGAHQSAAELATLSADSCPGGDSYLSRAEWRAWSSITLAAALQRLGSFPEAAETLRQCAEIIVPARTYTPAVQLLLVSSLQLALQGRPARAVELSALAYTIPFCANSIFFREFAGAQLDQLTAGLPLEERRSCRRRGKGLPFWPLLDGLPQELALLT